MKIALVINACGTGLAEQLGDIHAVLECCRGVTTDVHALFLHTGNMPERDMVNAVSANRMTLLQLREYQPENALKALAETLRDDLADLILCAGDHAGRELTVRLGFRLNGVSLVGVSAVSACPDGLLCSKQVYANNMNGDFLLVAKPVCLSTARGGKKAPCPEIFPADIARKDYTGLTEDYFVHNREIVAGVEKSCLTDAPFVVVAGRGVSSAEEVRGVAAAAGKMGAAFGVSRPVAMNAWAPLNRLVGVSGAMLSPKLSLVIGASGAGAFLAGVEGSECLVAVNSDPQAPIMHAADIAVPERYEDLIPVLAELIGSRNGAPRSA